MHELNPTPHRYQEPVSIPERELDGFVSAVSGLLGPDQTTSLREIWLDALASMDAMPDPTSPEWRIVTLAAWARLACRMIDIRFAGNGF